MIERVIIKIDVTTKNDKHYHLYVYQFIREHGDFENWDMILIERHSCVDRLDALKKERMYIESLKKCYIE